MEMANKAIDTALSELTHGTTAEATLADLLLAVSTANKLITDGFHEIPELKVIRDLRVKTYPLRESIIDLLPAGNVLQTATEGLQSGRKGLEPINMRSNSLGSLFGARS